METLLRAVVMYAFLMLIFIFAGRRSLAKIDTFDFVLLLILGECTQQALIGPDYSITTAFILIATLVGLEIMMSCLRQRWPAIEKVTSGGPLIIAEHGKPLWERMEKEKIDVDDILAAARERHGLENMKQIRFAILEGTGEISIIPEK